MTVFFTVIYCLILLCLVQLSVAKATVDYDKYHAKRQTKHCAGCKLWKNAVALFPEAVSILDAGAGNCAATRQIASAGKDVRAVEFSQFAVKKLCADLGDRVVAAPLKNLPYPNSSFDLVFSSEVLEHIPEGDVDKSISELVRVSKGDLFLTISLRRAGGDPHFPKRAKIHVTVQPRVWWHKKFVDHGCTLNEEVYNTLQRKLPGPIGKDIGRPACHKLFQAGEMEPWYFPYKCR
mmetsp:Transcript_39065/g.124369  ORF Transcript_39065/g.124369 Transcript_39065/m.124369 type:complete len:235 (+) Transcript_39065:1965-2669(+)|eukprot:CAMPEP_0182867450 /NCGR_PEP_ID=MMETSP0034_2-20130328/8724_1 /TAXON_ID=156128 /ORGANISM="Nephroselmis pyriformis, Strain CCMP717" /LENGTH=234 /DNA_ID=CAMNT_0024999807 /DNA_START=2415 /DNA_END=3119 /DNA_ORIENTATION=-